MDPSRPFKRGGLRPAKRARAVGLLLLSTRAAVSYLDCDYRAGDILLVGREFRRAPEEVHAAADLALRIPMRPRMRSLNVAVAAAMVMGEALRQLRAL